MSTWYRRIALSEHWAARFLRSVHRLQYTFSLPFPAIVAKPFVYVFLFLRSSYFFLFRVCLAEPFFRTYCTRIGNGCSFTVGREILIGRQCRIGANVAVFDTPGHPTDPERRRAGRPANPEDVRAIIIGDNVWIGSGAAIFPGVTIGDNSVVA